MTVRKLPPSFLHVCDLSGRTEISKYGRRQPGWTRIVLQCDGKEEVYVIDAAASEKFRVKLAELKADLSKEQPA